MENKNAKITTDKYKKMAEVGETIEDERFKYTQSKGANIFDEDDLVAPVRESSRTEMQPHPNVEEVVEEEPEPVKEIPAPREA